MPGNEPDTPWSRRSSFDQRLAFRARVPRLAIILSLFIVTSCGARQASADSLALARSVSGGGTVIYISLGVLLPLATDSSRGRDHALRAADVLLASSILAGTLKRITREERPEGDSRTSFPSEHAATAFAVATAESHFHPQQAPYWYAGATAIAWSRVRLRRHFYHDVVAGAALGYLTTHWELSRLRGLILTPLIHAQGGAGVQVTKLF